MTIMKKYIVFAASALALASCSSDEYLGSEPGQPMPPTNIGIRFGSNMGAFTRADYFGNDAAALLGNNFIVEGTKGATETSTTTSEAVFDNYLVVFEENTANTTESNTHNWEYVGKTEDDGKPETGLFAALGRAAQAQTIKYWDYSAEQYDFVAYSTGTKTMVSGTPADDGSEVKVSLINGATKGYTFEAKTATALQSCYISDIVTVKNADYGKPVTLQFKNLGSKIRLGIYETVPGYSVRNVEFYVDDSKGYKYVDAGTVATKDVFKVDVYDNAVPATLQHKAGDNWVAGTWYNNANPQTVIAEADAKKEVFAKVYYDSDGSTTYKVGDDYTTGTYYNRVGDTETNATLYGAAMPESGKITVTYPVVGSNYKTAEGYNKASVSVTPGDDTAAKKDFGALANLNTKYANETSTGAVFIGTTSASATFAGNVDLGYYQNVIPNPTSNTLTLRVNNVLESTDGSGEVINVWGAKAIVPAIYTKWQPNYAYTYLFKISDKTNGYTDELNGTEGLFPITFDAVVAEYTDVAGEQTTITTVATPSITTYQKDHVYTVDNEYNHADGAIYVMVKDNAGALIGNLGTTGQLYTVADPSNIGISEATVADALAMRTTDIATYPAVGRNGITLTKATSDATITKIIGVDNNEITVAAGSAASFTAAAAGTYAYVYTANVASITTNDKFQPVSGLADVDGYYPVAYSDIATAKTNGDVTAASAVAEANKIYFAVNTVGSTTTYTYVSSVVGKPVAEGLVWIDMTSASAASAGAPAADTFYFTKYTENNGQFAVKIIKVI